MGVAVWGKLFHVTETVATQLLLACHFHPPQQICCICLRKSTEVRPSRGVDGVTEGDGVYQDDPYVSDLLMRRKYIAFTFAGIALMGCMLVTWSIGANRRIPFVKKIGEYSIGIYTGTSPFELLPDAAIENPVLTARDVTDVPASFVADPFMVHCDNQWYMFFEVMNAASGHGDIGLAVSQDGRKWDYKQIVLDESFHLSYPNVFNWNGDWYMVPETRLAYAVRLYKAKVFPQEWVYVQDLVTGNYLDPSIFHDQGRWWMFAAERCDVLHLFHAESLTGPWIRHPRSPVVTLDGNIARPGGPVIKCNGRLYRYTQDCDPGYGNQVRAFEITKLTPEVYEEQPVPQNPVVQATGQGWNGEQMHHVDPHYVEGVGWIAAVDGYGNRLVFGLAY